MVIYHKGLIADRIRCQSYRQAINETVKKGNVVVDIGTGSGLLSYFAVEAGAKVVYAIEQNSAIIEDAKLIAKANCVDDRVVFIKGLSININLPQKADVIISEILGSYSIEEDVVKYMTDAKKRFLKRGGILMPARIEMYIAPVEAQKIYRSEIIFWEKKLYGFDFQSVREKAVNVRYAETLNQKGILAEPARIQAIDFYRFNGAVELYIDKTAIFHIKKRGIIHGLAGWFKAKLSDNITLSTSPYDKLTHWKNNFFPIESPLPVSRGDTVSVRIAAKKMFNTIHWSWDVKTKSMEFHHSTLKNISISKKDLIKLRRNSLLTEEL